MKELEKNRVYDISEIQRLELVSTQMLLVGHAACEVWDSSFIDLCRLSSSLPADVKSAELEKSLENIIYPMTTSEYETLKLRLSHTLGKFIENMPLCDADTARAMETITSAAETIKQRILELEQYIQPDVIEKNYCDYQSALTKLREIWEETTLTLDEKIQLANTLLKGLPEYTQFYGDPVNMQTGNFTYTYCDLTLKKNPELTLTRFYNAMDKNRGCLGRGWIHNWETHLDIQENQLLLIHADGREELFYQKTKNTYESSQKTAVTIQRTDSGCYCLTGEAAVLIFREDGKLIRLLYTAAAQTDITLTYREEKLIQIKAGTGESIALTYNQNHQLIQAKDHTGRIVTYTYTGKKLTAVTDPLGQTIQYNYGKNGRIDTVTDKRNLPTLKNTYDPYRRITAQAFPDGGKMTFTYMDGQNRIQVTEQNGNHITYCHDQKQRNILTAYSNGEKHYTYDERNNCISYTDKRNHTTTCSYDTYNRLTACTDAFSNQTDITYDKEGRPTEIITPGQAKTTYTYDTKGNLSKIITPLGDTISLNHEEDKKIKTILLPDQGRLSIAYDDRGNVKRIEYPDGTAAYYTYDLLNRVTETMDAAGNKTAYQYDLLGRIIRVTRADGKERTYQYNTMGEATAIRDFDGYSLCWEYNDINKPKSYTDKEGRTTRMKYDSMWNLTVQTDPEGGQTTYTYNSQNLLETITDPLGRTIRFSYDPNGNRTVIHYPDGTTRRYRYDALNRQTEEIDQQGRATARTYDPDGNVISITNPAGGQTILTYDKAGNKTTETNPAGEITVYTYTSLGKLKTKTEPGGKTETYHYQPGGKLIKKESSDGTWEVYSYDKTGNMADMTCQNGTRITYRYDCLGRLLETQRNGRREYTYTYDAMGNMTSRTNPSGYATVYRYSPQGNLVEATDPGGNKVCYTYNGRDEITEILQLTKEEILALQSAHPPAALHRTRFQRNAAGQIETITNALGQTQTYTYDIMGRVQTKTDHSAKTTGYCYYPDGKLKETVYPDEKTVHLSYDDMGNLTVIQDWLGKTTLEQDVMGRITQVTDWRGETVRYGWNPDGTRQWIQYPEGSKVNYTYDIGAKLTAITGGSFCLSYKYDANNRLAEIQRGNKITSSYEYNSRGQITQILHKKEQELLERLAYRYDPEGNITEACRTSSNPEYSSYHSYAYDKNNRLIRVTQTDNPDAAGVCPVSTIREYQYDGYGNRTRITRCLPGENTIQTEQTTYNPLNQPLETHIQPEQICRQYRYNQNGGLEQILENGKEINAYTYDSNDRLTHLYREGKLLQQNQYGGLGEFLTAENPMPDSQSFAATDYLVDNTHPYKRVLMEKGETERTYLWQDNDLLGILTEEAYLLTDRQHTPLRVVDREGRSQNLYSYDEFGVIEKKEEAIPLPFGYTGCQSESQANLYFVNARVYNSEQGAFLTKDLYTYMDYQTPGSINLYAYTQGNPLRYLDYSGHECIGEKDYFQRTAEMLLIGNFSDEFTGAGLAIQIILGIFGVDLLFDIRDLAADLTVNFEPSSSEWWVQIGLGIVAFLPAIGLLKFSDELTTGAKGGWKSLIKNTDEMAEGAKKAAKNSAEIIQAGKRNTDDIIKQINQLTQEAGEKADDVLADLKKAENGMDAVDDVIEGGSNPQSIAQYERLKAQYAADEVFHADRIGSALQNDPMHRAASYLSQDQLAQGKAYSFTGGDTRPYTLLQTQGQLNDVNGIYEYISDSLGQVTHQRFIPEGIYTGFSNQVVPKGGY